MIVGGVGGVVLSWWGKVGSWVGIRRSRSRFEAPSAWLLGCRSVVPINAAKELKRSTGHAIRRLSYASVITKTRDTL